MSSPPTDLPRVALLIDALPDPAALVTPDAAAETGFAIHHANPLFGALLAATGSARDAVAGLVDRVARSGRAESLEPEGVPIAFAASRPWSGHVLLVLQAAARASGSALARAEAARVASEERMRTIAELCPVPLAEVDREGVIHFVNPAFQRTYGYTRDEVPTVLHWWAAAYPDPEYREHVRTEWLARMDACLTTGEPFVPMQVTVRCRDGSDHTVLADFGPFGSSPDDPFLVSLFDITEVVAARRTEENARRLAERIIDSVGEGLCLYGRDGTIRYMNPLGARLLGYRPHEVIGVAAHALFHHTHEVGTASPESECALQRAVRFADAPQSGTDTFRRRDGRSFPVQFVSAPLVEGGRADSAVLTFRDITEEMRVLKSLTDSEVKLRKAQEMAGLGSYTCDLRTGRWDGTAVLDALFGVTADFDHTIAEWLTIIDPEFRQAAADHYAEVAQGKCDFRMDYRLTRPVDGAKRWVAANGELEFDAQGAPIRLIGTVHDITDRKEKEQALRALVQEKEALLKEVHHRVKNNLQVITSLLRLEIARTSQPDARSILGDMQSRIRTMAILHHSLYRTGDFASVDLGDYLRQLATQTHQALSSRATVVRLRCDLATLHVNIDQAIPCGLLVNELVSNCFKHAFPEGHEGAVRIALEPGSEPGRWCLEVADTGVGLPADFEARRGTSLGLQLASDLARQLGGALAADSPHGGGARFRLDFAPADLDHPAPL